jgi:Fe-S cluster biogenesis protein NfuA
MEDVPTPGKRIISQFNRMLGADGGRLELVGETPSALRVCYTAGTEACPTCTFDPSDLREMIVDSLRRNGSTIATVEMVCG